jgi:hypothetical protein
MTMLAAITVCGYITWPWMTMQQRGMLSNVLEVTRVVGRFSLRLIVFAKYAMCGKPLLEIPWRCSPVI